MKKLTLPISTHLMPDTMPNQHCYWRVKGNSLFRSSAAKCWNIKGKDRFHKLLQHHNAISEDRFYLGQAKAYWHEYAYFCVAFQDSRCSCRPSHC